MKWNIFLRHWLRSQKKWWPCEHTRFFKYPRWNSGTVPVPEYKDELGYKLGTGKKIVTWHFFTHGAFRSSQEVVETCPCVPDRNGIWKCLFLRRGNTEIHGEKPLGARTRTNNKLNPHSVWRRRQDSNRTTLVGGECYSALTTSPLRIFVSSATVHCFVAAAKLKFQTGHWPS